MSFQNPLNGFHFYFTDANAIPLLQRPARFCRLPGWFASSLALEEVEWPNNRCNDNCQPQPSGGQWCKIGGSDGRHCAGQTGTLADLSFRVRCSKYSSCVQFSKQSAVLTNASGFLGNLRYSPSKRAFGSGSPRSLRQAHKRFEHQTRG